LICFLFVPFALQSSLNSLVRHICSDSFSLVCRDIMAAVGRVSIGVGVKEKGVACNVPNNPVAKLSYYLHCVNACFDHVIPSEYTDYDNYYRFSEEHKAAVVILALFFNPKVFVELEILIPVPDGDSTLSGYTNNFYELEASVTVDLAAINDSASAIAHLRERQVQVSTKMVFSISWMKKFLLDPLEEILSAPDPSPRPVVVARPVVSTRTTPVYPSYPHPQLESGCCSGDTCDDDSCWCSRPMMHYCCLLSCMALIGLGVFIFLNYQWLWQMYIDRGYTPLYKQPFFISVVGSLLLGIILFCASCCRIRTRVNRRGYQWF